MHRQRREFCQSIMAASLAGAISITGSRAVASTSSQHLPAQIDAVRLDGKSTSIQRAALAELDDSLRGSLLVEGDYGYDGARRIWNGMHERFPALIAQAGSAGDVANVVTFARENGLLLSVKGGGHSWPGRSVADNALMLDLHSMNNVTINVKNQRAKVGGGALLYSLDHAAQRHGLATTAGVVSHTGVGGLTLGGGFGRLNRKLGLTIDNLLSATLVTADGQVRRISAEADPDLFWAIRGGGGNFGVVTEFEFQLHDVGQQMLGGTILWPIRQARDVLRFYTEFAASMSDEMYVAPTLTTGPGGEAVLLMDVCFCGDPRKGEAELADLRKRGRPMSDGVRLQPYLALQRRMDSLSPPGIRSYTKSGMLSSFTPPLVDDLLAGYEPGKGVNIGSFATGGKISRIDEQATAWPHRNAQMMMYSVAFWHDPGDDAARIKSVRQHWSLFEAHTGGYYANIQAEDVDVANNFGPAYPRLRSIKRDNDPQNLFRLNSNIPPA